MNRHNGWPAISAREAAEILFPRPTGLPDLPKEQCYNGHLIEDKLGYERKSYNGLLEMNDPEGVFPKVYMFCTPDDIRGIKVIEAKSHVNEDFWEDYQRPMGEQQVKFSCILVEGHMDIKPIPVLVEIYLGGLDIKMLKSGEVLGQDLYDEGRVKEWTLPYDRKEALDSLLEALRKYPLQKYTGDDCKKEPKLSRFMDRRFIEAMQIPQNRNCP